MRKTLARQGRLKAGTTPGSLDLDALHEIEAKPVHARYRAKQFLPELVRLGERHRYRCGTCGADHQWRGETLRAAFDRAVTADRTTIEVGVDL